MDFPDPEGCLMKKAAIIIAMLLCISAIAAENEIHSQFVLSTGEEASAEKENRIPLSEKLQSGFLYGKSLLTAKATFFLGSMDFSVEEPQLTSGSSWMAAGLRFIPKASSLLSFGVSADVFFDLPEEEDKDPHLFNYYVGPLLSLAYPVMPNLLYIYLDASVGAGLSHDTHAGSFDFMEQLYFGATADAGVYIQAIDDTSIPMIIRIDGSAAWIDNKLLLGFGFAFTFPFYII